MEIAIILFLILLNGIFSMSEIALVSARKVRLEGAAKRGSKSAQKALDLANSPDRFLSTIQIGITLIGVFMGMYSGESFRQPLIDFLSQFSFLRPYAYSLSVVLILVVVTYLTLVLGELVPKRIGMAKPETIAKTVAAPMNFLSRLTAPFIWLLTASTHLVIKILNLKNTNDGTVTEEEIKAFVQQGTEGGEVQEVEQDIVERAFFLGDKNIGGLATHRSDLVWIEISETPESIKSKVAENLHYVYPVVNGQIENIVGVVYLKDLFINIDKPDFRLTRYIRKAPFVHESLTVYSVLEQFKRSKIQYAFVIDDFGSIEGMTTLHDILETLVGNAGELDEEMSPLEQSDGSVLIDGQYPFYDFLEYFSLQDLYMENQYNTVSGLLLDKLGYIPAVGDKLHWMSFVLTVVEMDNARINKVSVIVQK